MGYRSRRASLLTWPGPQPAAAEVSRSAGVSGGSILHSLNTLPQRFQTSKTCYYCPAWNTHERYSYSTARYAPSGTRFRVLRTVPSLSP